LAETLLLANQPEAVFGVVDEGLRVTRLGHPAPRGIGAPPLRGRSGARPGRRQKSAGRLRRGHRAGAVDRRTILGSSIGARSQRGWRLTKTQGPNPAPLSAGLPGGQRRGVSVNRESGNHHYRLARSGRARMPSEI
jgi:hypothetical protein